MKTIVKERCVHVSIAESPEETPPSSLDSFQSEGHPVHVSPTPDYAGQLREADLRATRPRVAVMGAVHTHPHADTETIFSAVRTELPDVSRQAVYDVLHALTAAKLVRRIQPAGFVARYEARVGDNHHHVVCRSCGIIADVDCTVGEAPCLSPSDTGGFHLDEAEVVFWGLCPTCSTAQRYSLDSTDELRDHSPFTHSRKEQS